MSSILNINDYIELKDANHLLFKKQLSFKTVPEIIKQLDSIYSLLKNIKDSQVNFDFSQIEELDTAGFCLIINILQHCKSFIKIIITHAGTIHTYGELYDLEDFLHQFD